MIWALRCRADPKSTAALAHLTKICEEHLAGEYQIEVIDLVKKPQLASHDQIFAIRLY